MTTFTGRTTFQVEDCIHCGFLFGIPKEFVARRQEDHRSFYCPSCKGAMCWPQKSDKEKLEEQVRAAKENEEFWRERADERAKINASLHRSNSALRGVVTRTKNRVAAGVCVCCKRSFKDLARHMKNKHPNYGREEGKKS